MNKTEILLQMMQRPDEYTAAEWKEILSDDECRELYTMMSKIRCAFDTARTEKELSEDVIDSEWKRFVGTENQTSFRMILCGINQSRVAASIVGILLISGMAIAAIHFLHIDRALQSGQQAEATTTAHISHPSRNPSLPQDTIIVKPKRYDNIPLELILTELSDYYQIKVEYNHDSARQLRLFYQWKPEYTIEKVVEMLNNFESLQLHLKCDTLYVSSSIETRP